jgi:hypothetical protein
VVTGLQWGFDRCRTWEMVLLEVALVRPRSDWLCRGGSRNSGGEALVGHPSSWVKQPGWTSFGKERSWYLSTSVEHRAPGAADPRWSKPYKKGSLPFEHTRTG